MTFSKTSKNIRELKFHKIIKLIVKDSFTNFDIWDKRLTGLSFSLFIQSRFSKTGVTSASFHSLGKVPSVILSLITLVIMGRYEPQNCLRILSGIAP